MQQSMSKMQGKICLITGGTSGIGKPTARALAAMGATVIIVGRNSDRGQAAVQEIQTKTSNPSVSFMQADLSSQAAIRQLADNFKQQFRQLHVLINNAGGIFMSRALTVDGLEQTIAFNHLAYFLLTNLLLDMIKASAPARIINVSSSWHMRGRINLDDLQRTKRYNGWSAYGQSKLANIMFTQELAKHLQGTGVTVNCLHPGAVATSFAKNNGLLTRLVMTLLGLFMITPEKGAQTSIYLASSPKVEGITGQYFDNKKPAIPSSLANDDNTSRKLWEISEQLTHLVPQSEVQLA